jgi:hypothetical protein
MSRKKFELSDQVVVRLKAELHEAIKELFPAIAGPQQAINVRFSNWPVWVKRFQTFHRYGVDVAHGLVLLFGIGAKALPSWDSRTRRNNLSGGLGRQTDGRASGHCDLTSSIVPRGTSCHRAVELAFLLSGSLCTALTLQQRSCSSGTRCRQPRCGA